MQVKWLFPAWLFHLLPSFLLPTQSSSSQVSTNCSSSNRPSSLSLIDHQSASVQKSGPCSNCKLVLGNADLGDAWTAAVQAAGGILPWLGIGEVFGQGLGSRNSRSNQRSWIRNRTGGLSSSSGPIAGQYGGHGHIVAPVSLFSLRLFFAIFGHFLNKGNHSYFPAILAVSAAIMPPLENSPSKMVPTPVEQLEDDEPDNEIPIRQAGAMDQCAELQNHRIEPRLKTGSLENVVVEPKTGFKFPVILSDECQAEGPSLCSQVLAGVGVKSLTIVKLKSIKIYAFGFYVKSDCLRAQLGEQYGFVPPAELKHKSSFYEDLLRHELEMTVRLVVHYKGLKMGMVRSAFDTSLRNRLRKIKGVEDDEGLHIFNSYFSENLSLPRGTIIDFQWHPGGQLRTEIDGRLIGTIYSHHLCRAFFDLYIGDPPVSLKAKQDIGEKLGHMLRMS